MDKSTRSSSTCSAIKVKCLGICLGTLILLLQSTCTLTSLSASESFDPIELEYEALPIEHGFQSDSVYYNFIPLPSHRSKRQAANVSLDELDKSVLNKGVGAGATKKPIFQKPKDSSSLSVSKDVPEKKTVSSNQNAPTSASSTPSPPNPTALETTVQPPMKVFPALGPRTSTNNESAASNDTKPPTVWLNKTSEMQDEDGVVEFPVDLPNVTMSNHTYYTSTYYRNGQFLWTDLLDNATTHAQVHELLSDAHRRAATVKLEFDFPFYGHLINNVTMATGGFLYLGQHVHAWLAATQYVAPLMANFDSRFENATVRYLSNGTQFTVQWHDVVLHDAPNSGAFNFQTTLYKNGTITFAYKDIPLDISLVNDTHHPVKVGLSDAYISERNILFVKQKTIYEYHRIDLTNQSIVSGAAFVFTPLPTCLMYKTCEECTNHKTEFDCVWCPTAERCSDGTDRDRQDWIIKKCTIQNVKTPIECHISANTPSPSSDIYQSFDNHDKNDRRDVYPEHRAEEKSAVNNAPQEVTAVKKEDGIGASGVIAILFFIGIIFCAAGWTIYAYYNPHTPSGQLLIRFRPSQWGAFRRGEARYTAASIHM